jgi:hypothetical protein
LGKPARQNNSARENFAGAVVLFPANGTAKWRKADYRKESAQKRAKISGQRH